MSKHSGHIWNLTTYKSKQNHTDKTCVSTHLNTLRDELIWLCFISTECSFLYRAMPIEFGVEHTRAHTKHRRISPAANLNSNRDQTVTTGICSNGAIAIHITRQNTLNTYFMHLFSCRFFRLCGVVYLDKHGHRKFTTDHRRFNSLLAQHLRRQGNNRHYC